MKLIDKEKVIEYILKRKSEIYDEYGGIVTTQRGLVEYKVLQEMQSFLNTLEVKEVDLEKEIYDYFNEWQNVLCDEDCCNEGGFCCVLDENVKPVNIERCRKVAKHFFKLGINSK